METIFALCPRRKRQAGWACYFAAVPKLQEGQAEGGNRLAIVDGAAFGSEMEAVMQCIRYDDTQVKLYAPESFEYLILNSKIFPSGEVKKRLSETYQYADSKDYFSWE